MCPILLCATTFVFIYSTYTQKSYYNKRMSPDAKETSISKKSPIDKAHNHKNKFSEYMIYVIKTLHSLALQYLVECFVMVLLNTSSLSGHGSTGIVPACTGTEVNDKQTLLLHGAVQKTSISLSATNFRVDSLAVENLED